jgi:hypothetical protein
VIRDWDLWPWIVVDAAPGDTPLPLYRLTVNFRRVQHAITLALAPALYGFGRDAARFIRNYERANR